MSKHERLRSLLLAVPGWESAADDPQYVDAETGSLALACLANGLDIYVCGENSTPEKERVRDEAARLAWGDRALEELSLLRRARSGRLRDKQAIANDAYQRCLGALSAPEFDAVRYRAATEAGHAAYAAATGTAEVAERMREALLWFADEGHYEDTYRHGAGFVDAVGLSKAREALGLPVDRSDGTPMPLDEAIAEAGGQVLPLKRTPETVLRAMLRAYEAAAVEQEIAEHVRNPVRIYATLNDFESDMAAIRRMLANYVANRVTPSRADWNGRLVADYEARLSGQRPLDAPPLEEP